MNSHRTKNIVSKMINSIRTKNGKLKTKDKDQLSNKNLWIKNRAIKISPPLNKQMYDPMCIEL